jgi:hypothetical protein
VRCVSAAGPGLSYALMTALSLQAERMQLWAWRMFP